MARVMKFDAQISALIPGAHYDRLKSIETAHPVSLADVIRDVIEAGLPSVEAKYAALEVSAEQPTS